MGSERLQPTEVRYIKLGSGGAWAKESLNKGHVSFGYPSIPHELCERKDWDEVRRLLSDRRSAGAITAGITEVTTFYEMGEGCLWITFADGHLWWACARTDVVWLGDGGDGGPSRFRRTIGAWSNTDLNRMPLRIADLSSNLTRTANFRATICSVPAKSYLLRRINAIEEPVVARAQEARERMIAAAAEMIRGLHWADFETLADLIFARSGWQRTSRLGGALTDIDLLMEQPVTRERAFVQVKSTASQSVVDDYLQRFRTSGHNRFFFVCHSAQGNLTLPDEPQLHLFEGSRLAEVSVKTGLFDWLVERSG